MSDGTSFTPISCEIRSSNAESRGGDGNRLACADRGYRKARASSERSVEIGGILLLLCRNTKFASSTDVHAALSLMGPARTGIQLWS